MGEKREIKALTEIIYCTINYTAQGIPEGSFISGSSHGGIKGCIFM